MPGEEEARRETSPPRASARAPAEQRVEHVPAVELPDRDEVQRGDEEAEPGGEGDRVEEDVRARRRARRGRAAARPR